MDEKRHLVDNSKEDESKPFFSLSNILLLDRAMGLFPSGIFGSNDNSSEDTNILTSDSESTIEVGSEATEEADSTLEQASGNGVTDKFKDCFNEDPKKFESLSIKKVSDRPMLRKAMTLEEYGLTADDIGDTNGGEHNNDGEEHIGGGEHDDGGEDNYDCYTTYYSDSEIDEKEFRHQEYLEDLQREKEFNEKYVDGFSDDYNDYESDDQHSYGSTYSLVSNLSELMINYPEDNEKKEVNESSDKDGKKKDEVKEDNSDIKSSRKIDEEKSGEVETKDELKENNPDNEDSRKKVNKTSDIAGRKVEIKEDNSDKGSRKEDEVIENSNKGGGKIEVTKDKETRRGNERNR